jgi:malate dehydrogenase (oxaloacetate-decarboxylating)
MPNLLSSQPKIIRILRLKLMDKPGFLGRIATKLGELKANIGEISIVNQGPDFLVRDISLQLIDENHLNLVIAGIDNLDGVSIQSLIDPVQVIHEGGKIGIKSRVNLDSLATMRKIYTPGVAEICKLIAKDIKSGLKYTAIPNTVAVITNGSAILGLGNIGPVAGMPVMEGKSVIFEQMVGISGIPILVDSNDPKVVIETIRSIAPTFGAIQLEDIAAPMCFEIEQRLQETLSIPVLHDDQHATAAVVLACLMTISKRTDIKIHDCRVGIIGLGAAGIGISKLLLAYGVKEIFGTDLREEAMQRLQALNGKAVTLAEVMSASDIVICTTGVPNLIKPEMIRYGQVILALSNPDPEIDPELAKQAGALFAADGRTINNALAFPGLFKGALQSAATKFTDEMKIAAAVAIAGQTKADNLVPSILEKEVHVAVATAVASAWKNK